MRRILIGLLMGALTVGCGDSDVPNAGSNGATDTGETTAPTDLDDNTDTEDGSTDDVGRTDLDMVEDPDRSDSAEDVQSDVHEDDLSDAGGPECPQGVPEPSPPMEACEPTCPAYGTYLQDIMQGTHGFWFTAPSLTVNESGGVLAVDSLTFRCGSTTSSSDTDFDIPLVHGETGVLHTPAGYSPPGELRANPDCGEYRGSFLFEGVAGGCDFEYGVVFIRNLEGATVVVEPNSLAVREGEYAEFYLAIQDSDCVESANITFEPDPLPDWVGAERLDGNRWVFRLRPSFVDAGEHVISVRTRERGSSPWGQPEVAVTVEEAGPGGCLVDSHCGDCGLCGRGICRKQWACADEAECSVGEVCCGGVCQPPCITQADCPTNRACVDGGCFTHPACVVSSQCHSGEGCRDHVCTAVDCSTDAECVGTELCYEGKCQHLSCEPVCPSETRCTRAFVFGTPFCSRACDSSEECPDRLSRCDDGACIEPIPCTEFQPCANDSDCSEEEAICVGGRCLVQAEHHSCDTTPDCDAGHYCDDGGCVLMGIRACESVADCGGPPAICPDEGGFDHYAHLCQCHDGTCPENQVCQTSGLMSGGDFCMDTSIRREVSEGCPMGSACVEGFCSPPSRELPLGNPCGASCAPGQYCDRILVDCSDQGFLGGACIDVLSECPPDGPPVCGCDDVTYDSDCERIRAGVAMATVGSCE